MNEMELLNWVRGPGLQIASAVFVAGIALRLFEVFSLGRGKDLSPTRPGQGGSGWRTMLMRSFPRAPLMRGALVTYVSGYVFHLGMFVVVLFFVPHIDLFANQFGIRWPGLPTPLIDVIALLSIVALAVALFHRLSHPVKRFLSTFQDYATWLLTFAPLVTGYLAFHHQLLPYTTMLAVHILSVEALMVFFPFTKLFHGLSTFVARRYAGTMLAHKGAEL
jgi:nitrate reductase gamma subunit